MSLLEAMQMVCDDGQKIAATCRQCGVKDMDVCRSRDCDNLVEVLAQVILVRELTAKGLLKVKA